MKTWGAFAVAAVIVGFAAGASRAAGDEVPSIDDLPRKVRVALFTAQEHIQKVDFAGAVESLEEFIEDNPGDDHFWLRFFLADSYAHLERFDESLDHYEACVRLEPRFAQGWLKLGEIAYGAGRYGRAAEAIHKGYGLSEDKRHELLYYAAASYILDRQSASALPLLEELLDGRHGEPRLEWYRALVSAAIDASEVERGRKAVDDMLARFGDDPDAWFLAFQFGAGTGDYRQAAVALTVVGYLRPLTRHERVQLGDLYSVIEAPLVATEYYAPAMADSASAGEVERLASAYIASYNNSAALEVLTRSVREKPTARLWSLLGDLHFMQAQYEDAHRAFEASAALDPEDGRPYLMMGYCALEVGNGEDAVASLELASQFEPQAERAQSLLERARVRLAASDPQTGD